MDDYNSTTLSRFPQGREKEEERAQEAAAVLLAAEQGIQERQQREEETLPEWDGREAEFVEDTDAAVYEEKYTGIRITYQLTSDEVADCLKHAGFYQKTKTRTVVETVLCALLSVFFAVDCALGFDGFKLFLSVLCAGLIALLWWGYHGRIRQRARELSGKESVVCIYPDEVEIGAQGDWCIPLDGTSEMEEFNGKFLLYTRSDKLVCIPIRSIEPNVLADVQAMLAAGTIPRQEESYE